MELQEFKDMLRVDGNYDDIQLTLLLTAAKNYILESVNLRNEAHKQAVLRDERFGMLSALLAAVWYENKMLMTETTVQLQVLPHSLVPMIQQLDFIEDYEAEPEPEPEPTEPEPTDPPEEPIEPEPEPEPEIMSFSASSMYGDYYSWSGYITSALVMYITGGSNIEEGLTFTKNGVRYRAIEEIEYKQWQLEVY